MNLIEYSQSIMGWVGACVSLISLLHHLVSCNWLTGLSVSHSISCYIMSRVSPTACLSSVLDWGTKGTCDAGKRDGGLSGPLCDCQQIGQVTREQAWLCQEADELGDVCPV